MTLHSRYGGSNAHRWMACPGSVHLQALATRPETVNDAAERGTAMHNYAEKILKNESVTTEGLSDDELGMVAGYVDAITSLEAGKPLGRGIEMMITCYGIHPDAFGSVDYLAYDAENLYIVDLKTGRTPVDVIDNVQLAYYCIGTISTLSLINDRKIHLGIYQPTVSKEIQWWNPTMDQIREIKQKMIAATKSVELVAGDHCKYCKAEGFCGIRRESMAIVKTPVVNMNPQQIADIWDMLPQIESWVKAVSAEADELAKTGALPDHHLTEGRARPLAWVDALNAAAALKKLGLDDAITHNPPQPPALKTPTQIAKAIGKDGGHQLEGIAERPPSNMVIVRSIQSEAIRSLTDW